MSDPAVPELTKSNGSAVSRIRARHKGKRKPLRLAVPRFEGDVVFDCKPINTKTLKVVGRGKSARLSNAQIIADSCLEVFVRTEDGEVISIKDDEKLQHAVRFDGVLADLFELHGDTPAKIVLSMYADDVVVHDHAKRIYDWQTGKDLDEDIDDEELEDMAGEADAAT